MNRLSREKSPYLLQHAANPVDWYPWNDAAFEKARREDKPLFLSIGYSTCHWCHVMERESFEDEAIAALLNESFVSVKVDREERPDVDRVYMSAVQALTGSGGWPLSVFLTPDLKPFFGGTYFPPAPRWGQPGFPQLLVRIAELWKTRRAELTRDAEQLAAALKTYVRAASSKAPLDKAWLEQASRQLAARFDPVHGGFGGAPKFPMPVNLEFLLSRHAAFGDAEALKFVVATLKAMARGGIHDQVGGGFHRYSTDERWFLPHFEKMLYDNAQLACVYLEAYRTVQEEELAAVARDTLDYLLRDMAHPEGGFYSAEDADSAAPGGTEKSEGAFYLWTADELKRILGEADAALFSNHYGIEPSGNVEHDPHGEFSGKNLPYPVKDAAGEEGQLKDVLAKLLKARAERPRPARDEKILVSWNGLALSAFAKGFQVLGEPRYLDAARKAAAFLRSELWDGKTKALFHRWAGGERAIPGNADDHAFLVQGLLDLYEADFDPAWLEWSLELTRRQERLFAAEEGGYYLTAEGADDRLLARVLEDQDNVEPCASSVAVSNLLRLAEITGDRKLRESAEKTLTFFGGALRDRPLALPRMLTAASAALRGPMQVVITGDVTRNPGRELLKEAREHLFRPHALILIPDEAARKRLAALSPGLELYRPKKETVAYVCFDFACEKPASDAASLREILKKAESRGR